MSPLVKTMIETVNEQTKSKRSREHIRYVPPSKLMKGDVICKPTAAQLVELLDQYPDEYEPGGIGLKYGMHEVQQDDAFLDMPWQDACDLVRASGEDSEGGRDEKKLMEFFKWESDRKPFRKSVMKALLDEGIEEVREFFA